MAAEIIPISSINIDSQNYNGQDTNLIPTFEVNTNFNSSSYIEFSIYDNNYDLISVDYNFTQYTVLNNGQASLDNNISQIEIDPEKVLINYGYTQGEYVTHFGFFDKQIGSSLQQLYISEISGDRTELRLDSTALTNIDVVEQTNLFVQDREDSNYFVDFYLNFGSNNLVIAVNISLDNQDINNPTVLIKLYEPLPEEYDINSTLWIVTSIEEPSTYQVIFQEDPITVVDTISVKGPNFNIDLKDQINNSTLSLDYTSLTTTALTSSFNQLSSLLEEKEIDINIDYTDFSNFVHFSSIQTRLENFYYKVQLIEQYSNSISVLNNTTNNNPSASIAVYETYINNIITNFDGYEYYLYYESGSYAWPKTNNQKPYTLAASNSPQVLSWFGSTNYSSPYYGGIILSASLFDNDNKDNLLYTIPEYLRDDPANDPYQVFIEMMGQFYDNIWIYYKDVSNKYNADTRLEYGVSKDIVADAIREFGIKLYQNNFSNDDLYTAFIGLTPQGGLFPFPNITGSLPTPSGFEYVDTLISASNDFMPLDDVNKSLYKRIYHNLPYLLKSKGTLPGLRTLITSYGIPDTVLRIKEYGGKDKVNTNDWDYWQDTFNYAFYNPGNNYITSSWQVNSDWNSLDNVPNTIQFRFKPGKLPQNNIRFSQSLWYLGSPTGPALLLEYTGSGYVTGSYSGSIIDPYYQYANLIFYPDATNYPASSASIYLPFYDGGWWSVMVTRTPTISGTSSFEVHAGNKIYEGGDNGTLLGFYTTSSIVEADSAWTGSIASFFNRGNIITSKTYQTFSGSFQEIRYYKSVLDKNTFDNYVMNPHSIEGNYNFYSPYNDINNASPDELIYRLSLGGELYTGSNSITGSFSIHPKVTGSWIPTSSFASNSGARFRFVPEFVPNTEYFFYSQPIVGIKNSISDKIRVENDTIPSGDTLSAFRSLAQNIEISQSYTANANLLEVAFSPQNEINEDIMDQLKAFNIGEYIGDPRFRSSSALSYPELDTLRNAYFEKYTKNYDLNDFIRLIKFFDNSLFKMIKDFVPARTSLASGIVIKQSILERNRYPEPQVNNHSTIAYTTSGSQNNTPFTFQNIVVSGTLAPSWNNYQPGTVENFSGGPGGVFNPYNSILTSPYGANGTGPSNIYFLTQSWSESIVTPSGSVVMLHSTQDEFYNGEFSGSILTVTTQSLAQPYPLNLVNFEYKHVHYNYSTTEIANGIFDSNFINSVTSPKNGEIFFLNVKENPPLPNPHVGVKYLKISKFDCNGNDATIPLGQIDTLYINNVYTPTSGYYEYKVLVINEQPNYYLYRVLNNNPLVINGVSPNQVLDYTVSASITLGKSIPTGTTPYTFYLTASINPLNYYNSSSGYTTFGNTPNTPLSFTASILARTSAGTAALNFNYQQIIPGSPGSGTVTSQTFNITTTPTTFSISGSFYPLQGSSYYLWAVVPVGGPVSVGNTEFLITQSRAVSTVNCESVILEPYIELPNYYNSNFNPLINNAEIARLNSIYQDIDYSTNILTPVNFNFLISGSALKAAVQDSNYTSKRVINPRYNGVKSTSQLLNTWTPGDTGTYGKTPTVDNLKTMVAYCDSISGWPSERMNASAIHVLYLIKSDGTVIIPNTSENSLYDIRGTFETGERMLINTQTISAGGTQYRNVIRGGTRIEPILYTQFGSSPNAAWDTTMSFEDIVLTVSGSVGNYTGLYSTTGSSIQVFGNIPTKVSFSNALYGNSYLSNNGYQITTGPIGDGVNLYLDAEVKYVAVVPLGSTINYTIELFIYKNGTPLLDANGQPVSISDFPSYNTFTGANINTISISSSIPNTSLTANDIYTVYVKWIGNIAGGSFFIGPDSTFKIHQSPIATSPVTSSGVNSIWGWPNKTTYPNIITSSESTLVNLYGDPNVKMIDITGSGFNPVTLPWSIEYADEFRFEGREDFVYQVGKIFGPAESGSDRITQTGSIEVHFNYDLPVSASASIFNLDHFLIRRYVDDASLILMEGYRPTNASGPYIVRPEYVVPELNRSVDEFILDLTQKGLI
jgi:hypothetical protein